MYWLFIYHSCSGNIVWFFPPMPFIKFCGNSRADGARGPCMTTTNYSYLKLTLIFDVKCSWQRRCECSGGNESRARADVYAHTDTPQNLPVAPNPICAKPEKLCPLGEVSVSCMMRTFWSTTDGIIRNQITIYTGQHESIFCFRVNFCIKQHNWWKY